MSDSGSEEEYTVQTILAARIGKKGRKKEWQYHVKWQGYDDPSDNTWEPAASFDGGSEHFMDKFWMSANTGGRDHRKLDDFKIGEEIKYFPVGPPRGLKKKKEKEKASTGTSEKPPQAADVSPVKEKVGGSETTHKKTKDSQADKDNRKSSSKRKATEETPPLPKPAKRLKGRLIERSPSALSTTSGRSSSPLFSPARKARVRAESPVLDIAADTQMVHASPFIGESASFIAVESPQASPVPTTAEAAAPAQPRRRPKIPAHRARAANPRVKIHEPHLSRAMNGALSVKARIMRQNTDSKLNVTSPTGASGGSSPMEPGATLVNVAQESEFMRSESDTVVENLVSPPVKHSQTTTRPKMPTNKSQKEENELPDFVEDPQDLRSVKSPQSNRASDRSTLTGSTSLTVTGQRGPHPNVFGPLGSVTAVGTGAASSAPLRSSGIYLNMAVDPGTSCEISLVLEERVSTMGATKNHISVPGKFFGPKWSKDLVSALRADGSCSRIMSVSNPTQKQSRIYRHFLEHLRNGEIFIVHHNQRILLFSLPESGTQHLLNIPPHLSGDRNNPILSEASIREHDSFANTVLAAQPELWKP